MGLAILVLYLVTMGWILCGKGGKTSVIDSGSGSKEWEKSDVVIASSEEKDKGKKEEKRRLWIRKCSRNKQYYRIGNMVRKGNIGS